LNKVPFILVNGPANIRRLADGQLSDVAPTVLELMGLPQPKEMTGHSLLHPSEDTALRARDSALRASAQ
jgi:2,3-bisphosphoglycerate-independent phosphoglycerate mutase